MFCSIFLLQAILLEFCAAGYDLETSYTSTNWFDQFSFYTVGSLIPYRMLPLTVLITCLSRPTLLMGM